MSTKVEPCGATPGAEERLPSPFGLEALVAGRLEGAERERILEGILADRAGPALLRLALELKPEAEALAGELDRLRAAEAPRRFRAGWFAPLAAAALLVLFLLPRVAERPPNEAPGLAGDAAPIMLADFEAVSADAEPSIFASQFDG